MDIELINLNTVNIWTISTAIIASSLALFILVTRKKQTSYNNLPPGPKPLPVIGSIYRHGADVKPDTLAELAREYGDVFCIYIGPQRVIVLNSYAAAREAMMRPWEFSHRGLRDKYTWKLCRTERMYGMFSQDYTAALVNQRNTTITIMRRLGIGKPIMEEIILNEIDAIGQIYRNHGDIPIDPDDSIHTSFANIIMHVLFNKRFDHGDPEVKYLLQQAFNFIQNIMVTALIDSMPVLRFVPPFKGQLDKFVTGTLEICKFVDKTSQHIFDNFEPENTPCFVQSWAEHFYNKETKKVDTDRTELNFLLHDLFTGGLETSAVGMKWMLIYLANRQQMQQSLFDEIEHEVGLDRPVRLSDKETLPLVEATVWELLRHVSVTPVVPHESTRDDDVELCGFTIPKQSMVLMNIYGIHMSEETWGGDAKDFRPERHLDEAGKFTKHLHLIPLSLGKRMCPGEILARQELFLYIGNLVQQFKFSPPEGVERIDETRVFHSTTCPRAYKIKIIPRGTKVL